jgi:hypothetical protein
MAGREFLGMTCFLQATPGWYGGICEVTDVGSKEIPRYDRCV